MKLEQMVGTVKAKLNALSMRERWIVGCGVLAALLILLYSQLLAPLHNAINTMDKNLVGLRGDLVWLRSRTNIDLGQDEAAPLEGQNEALVAILERSARSFELDSSIVQLSPSEEGSLVRVTLEDADFNNWLRWVAVLDQQYGVTVVDAVVERQAEPNIAEIRMSFRRN